MSQVQRFGKTFDDEKECVIINFLFQNLWFTRTKGRYRFFENGKT